MNAPLTRSDGGRLDDLLYEAGDRIADVARELKRNGWDCAVDASDIIKRIDEFRGELSEGFEKEFPAEPDERDNPHAHNGCSGCTGVSNADFFDFDSFNSERR
jgi:hypothetical protein